jgi:hypothetical protein
LTYDQVNQLGFIDYHHTHPDMTHDVRFSLPERQLGKADIVFKVKKGQLKFGTLKISKGSIVWFPRSTSKGYKVGWKKFDEFMQERTKREKR